MFLELINKNYDELKSKIDYESDYYKHLNKYISLSVRKELPYLKFKEFKKITLINLMDTMSGTDNLNYFQVPSIVTLEAMRNRMDDIRHKYSNEEYDKVIAGCTWLLTMIECGYINEGDYINLADYKMSKFISVKKDKYKINIDDTERYAKKLEKESRYIRGDGTRASRA